MIRVWRETTINNKENMTRLEKELNNLQKEKEKTKILAEYKEELSIIIGDLMEKNKENGNNDYTNGVHDGYLNVLMKLGIGGLYYAE